MGQEIERKWRVRKLPKDYKHFPCKLLEQAYLCQNPTLRIRKESSISEGEERGGISEGRTQEEYIFCYKGRGRLSREEYNLPLTKEAYETLIRKTEGRVIRKFRYAIPHGAYTVELDIFQGATLLCGSGVFFRRGGSFFSAIRLVFRGTYRGKRLFQCRTQFCKGAFQS